MALPIAERQLRRTDTEIAGFEEVFKTHFKNLHAYATSLVKDEAAAEEMVQNVFCRIWEKKEKIDFHTSSKAYLYRSVYHECLNLIKHRKVRDAYQVYQKSRPPENNLSPANKIQLNELEWNLNKALDALPQQCRAIFTMSRYEELKYQEIADRMGLSVKTIESQMGKALRILREKLADFIPLFLLILLNL